MHKTITKHAEAKQVQDTHKPCTQSHAHARARTTKRMQTTQMDKQALSDADRVFGREPPKAPKKKKLWEKK
jgi:hypothetical protein